MADAGNSKEKLLLVWEQKQFGLNEIQKVIRALIPFFSLRLCTPEAEGNIKEPDLNFGSGREITASDFPSLLSNIRRVLLPEISDELLKELSEGQLQNPIAAIIMEALCIGLPVFALKPVRNGNSLRSKAAAAYLSRRREQFAYCGIQPISWEELYSGNVLQAENMAGRQSFQSGPSGLAKITHAVITAEDILRFSRDYEKELLMHPGDCITPLAADTAKELGIMIKKEL